MALIVTAMVARIWREQVLPISNERNSSPKLMAKEKVSASWRNCGSWMDGSVPTKDDEA